MAILTKTKISTEFGDFDVAYHKNKKYEVVSLSTGDLTKDTPIVWFKSSCLFGEAFHSIDCDCNSQIIETMKLIKKHGAGVIIYSYQEGRGIGLLNKMKEMEIQRVEGLDTVEALKKLGIKKNDLRDYKVEVQALKDLGVSEEILTFTGNPNKFRALEDAGFMVMGFLEADDKSVKLSDRAKDELRTKVEKMGYVYKKD